MSDHDDFAFEPVPGLPAHLPKGEQMLWQGRPDTWALAREAFLLRWAVGYLMVVAAIRFVVALADAPVGYALAVSLPYAILGLLAGAILLLMAWAQARATVYTITTERVAMRIGAALSVTFNLPFAQLAAARIDLRKGGTGTIAIETTGEDKLSYLVLWPHVRPWFMKKPQPALRCIPDAARVAELLSEAAQARLLRPQVARVDRPDGITAAAVAAE
jgi:hypothetical protein